MKIKILALCGSWATAAWASPMVCDFESRIEPSSICHFENLPDASLNFWGIGSRPGFPANTVGAPAYSCGSIRAVDYKMTVFSPAKGIDYKMLVGHPSATRSYKLMIKEVDIGPRKSE